MPLDVPPPRGSRFGSPLVLSRVHWVRPELVAEVKIQTWTDDNLLRQVVYEGLREDKPAREVRRGRELEDLPRDPDHPAVLADLDPNSTARRSAFRRAYLGRRLGNRAPRAILLGGRSDKERAHRGAPGGMTAGKITSPTS